MKKLLPFILIGVVALVGIGVALFFFLGREPKEKPIVYFEYPLGEQYTNILPEDQNSTARKPVLKYSPVIQYTSEATLAQLNEKSTFIKNEVRKYFMGRNATQINRLDRVQEDLTELIIEILESDTDTITNVLFLEFIVQ
jgi:flagellar basal body-associated protein FliL